MRPVLHRERFILATALICVVLTTLAPAAHAQQAPAQLRDTTITVRRVSPRSALFRSLLIPGWGQLSVHAYARGAFFIAAQGASWYMLVKSSSRLSDAKDTRDESVAFTSDTLQARMAQDSVLRKQLEVPGAFDARVDQDTTVQRLRGLVESRDQQRQDWITYTLFFTLASGVDAYVAAQLADFPATIDAQPTTGGGVQLRVTTPFPRRR